EGCLALPEHQGVGGPGGRPGASLRGDGGERVGAQAGAPQPEAQHPPLRRPLPLHPARRRPGVRPVDALLRAPDAAAASGYTRSRLACLPPRSRPPYIARRHDSAHPARSAIMAKNSTFDITSAVDLQEVDNAVNQAAKEVGQRYDFKGATAEIDFSKEEGTLTLLADDDYKLTALVDILQSKLIKRSVPIRNLDYGKVEPAAGSKVRQVVTLQQGISTEKGKEIVKAIKTGGFKKVQAQIQDDQVRVQSPSIDELQAV